MKETWDATFQESTEIFVVGTFDTPDEADLYAAQFHGEMKYLGAARRMLKKELSKHIAMRNLAMTLAGLPARPPTSKSSRRIGRITRWHDDELYGFLVDPNGKTWFISRDRLIEPLDPSIKMDSQVMFSGSPHNRPGKKHPTAETIRPLTSDIHQAQERHPADQPSPPPT